MKKFIALICVIVVVSLGAMWSSYYLKDRKIQSQEQYARIFMEKQFSSFVKTWDVGRVPVLFIENAEVYNIAKLLVHIKETVGTCEMKTMAYCESQERYRETKQDEYYTDKGYSIHCPFVLTCEKEQQATGEAIFYPDGYIAKLFAFTITYDE